MEPKPLEQQLLEATFRIFRVQRHRMHPEELTPAETFIISHIHRRGAGRGMRVSDIAERMMVTTSGVTQFVKALEARGLVERVRSDEDRRVVMVHTTPAGDALMEKSMERMRASYLRLVRHLGHEDSRHVLDAFVLVADFLEEDARDELSCDER